jgi:DNA-binding XRE family transcriptional regulator
MYPLGEDRICMCDGLPDEDDIAAVIAAREEDVRFSKSIEEERGCPAEITIPIEVIEAKLDGAHPIKAWREYRGWTQVDLSLKSRVGRDLIAQIETRRKNGSVETLDRIARALGVPIEALIEVPEA